MNNKGYTMVELLIAIMISAIIVGAVMLSYTGTLKVFKDVKSVSDTIQTKTPSIELIARYFERWGVGVVSQVHRADCRSCSDYPTDCCPSESKTIFIKETNGCSDVTFFGNIYGFGFVRGPDPISDPADILSCRLSITQSQNCYILWRDNFPLNDVVNNIPIPLEATGLSVQNQECLTLTAGTGSNAKISSILQAKNGNTPKTIKVKAGDSLQRFPHRIRLYCANNESDGGRKWLYVDLSDTSSYCGSNENATPIAPVDEFIATAMPAETTCDPEKGGTGCSAVKVSITFRSSSQKYAGQFDTYTVTKIFGR
jgi:prepilin-type N-terminal cleavage/methylation domain-containing protein